MNTHTHIFLCLQSAFAQIHLSVCYIEFENISHQSFNQLINICCRFIFHASAANLDRCEIA